MKRKIILVLKALAMTFVVAYIAAGAVLIAKLIYIIANM